MSPESSRFAEVLSFWTTFMTMVSGMPFSVRRRAVRAPGVPVADLVGVVVARGGLGQLVGAGAVGGRGQRLAVAHPGLADHRQAGEAVEHERRRLRQRDRHGAGGVVGRRGRADRQEGAEVGALVLGVADVVDVAGGGRRGEVAAVGAGDALGEGEGDGRAVDRPLGGELRLDLTGLGVDRDQVVVRELVDGEQLAAGGGLRVELARVARDRHGERAAVDVLAVTSPPPLLPELLLGVVAVAPAAAAGECDGGERGLRGCPR